MNRLTSLRQKRGKIIKELEAVLDAASQDGDRALTEEESGDYTSKEADLKAVQEQIEREERLLEEKAKTAVPVAGGSGESTPRVDVTPNGIIAPKREKGNAVARMIRALAMGRGDCRRAAEYCERVFLDAEVAKALAAGDAEAGGFIVPPNFREEIIELLRPASAVRRLMPTIVPLDNGTATIPKLTGGASAAYVGENTNITKTEPTFGQLKLTERKLAALVPISNDLIRNASPSADGVVRDDLVAALAQKQDLEFIRGAGTGAGPKGLRYWAPTANQITVNATVNLANITVDLGKLVLALKGANVRMIRPGWLMSPRSEHYLMTIRDTNGNFAFRAEMLAGRLWGYPFGVTSQIPENLAVTGSSESEIYLADFADVVIGEASALVLDVSDTAAYHDGSNVVASFSLDQTVIRAIERHDFGMRHDASVAVLTDVDWGA